MKLVEKLAHRYAAAVTIEQRSLNQLRQVKQITDQAYLQNIGLESKEYAAFIAGFKQAREMAKEEWRLALLKAQAAQQQQGYSGYPDPNFDALGEEEVD